MDTFVCLFRNGFCVVKDLLPSTHWLMQPWLGPVTQIECMIAPLQFAAVYFNLTSAATKVWAAASYYVLSPVLSDEQWAQALAMSSTAPKPAALLAADGLRTHGVNRRQSLIIALCQFVLIFMFLGLTFNSLHMSDVLAKNWAAVAPYYSSAHHDSFLNWMLFFSEFGLCFFLCQMVATVIGELRAAADKRRLADAVSFAGKKSSSGLLDAPAALPLVHGAAGTLPPLPLAPWSQPSWTVKLEDPFGLGAVHEYLAQLESSHGAALKAVRAQPAAIAKELQVQSEVHVLNAAYEAVLTFLNVLALVGYATFPIAFLATEGAVSSVLPQWPGHAVATDQGNLLGDAAWTVEPLLMLTVPLLISAAARKRRADADALAKKTK